MADEKRTELNWEDLRVFAALARHGTLSATARALRVNHATVSRRVAGLEAATGYPLFERRADGYRLTEHGRAILAEASAMEAAAAMIRDRLALPSGPVGRVRLTTTRSIADAVLSPHLRPMREAYPGVQLEILTDLRVRSLAQRDADIALRLGKPGDSGLTGRRVAMIRYGFYGSSERREDCRHGRTVPLIAYDTDSDFVGEAAWLNANFADHPVALRSNSHIAQAQAAASGIGIAMLPRYVAAGVPGLVEIALGPPLADRELWMLTPTDLADVARIRAVWQSIIAIFDAQPAMF